MRREPGAVPPQVLIRNKSACFIEMGKLTIPICRRESRSADLLYVSPDGVEALIALEVKAISISAWSGVMHTSATLTQVTAPDARTIRNRGARCIIARLLQIYREVGHVRAPGRRRRHHRITVFRGAR